MPFSLMIMWLIVYFINHKRNSFKRLKVLLPIIIITVGITYLIVYKIFHNGLDRNDLFNCIALSCTIDNLIYVYQKKNMEKENKVK